MTRALNSVGAYHLFDKVIENPTANAIEVSIEVLNRKCEVFEYC